MDYKKQRRGKTCWGQQRRALDPRMLQRPVVMELELRTSWETLKFSLKSMLRVLRSLLCSKYKKKTKIWIIYSSYPYWMVRFNLQKYAWVGWIWSDRFQVLVEAFKRMFPDLQVNVPEELKRYKELAEQVPDYISDNLLR